MDWSDSNDRKLIAYVKRHEILYNPKRSKDYIQATKEIWQTIADSLGMPVIKCKRRWSNLKYVYLQLLIRKMDKEKRKYNRKPWLYEAEMSFLKPYLKQKEASRRSSRILLPENSFNTDQGNETMTSELIACNDLPSRSPSPSIQILKGMSKEPQIVGSMSLADYSNIILFPRDTLMKYFEAVAEIVRELPPLLQVKVKSEISKIVHQAEMEHVQQVELQPYLQSKNNFLQSNPTPANNLMHSQYSVECSLMKNEHPG